jgi:aminoglycoside/choline kinase family phosphotransferase
MTPDALRAAFAEATGLRGASATVARLPGGAGNRTYWRVAEGDTSVVVMELPPEPAKSEEASKAEAPPELPFLNVRRYLARLGVRVPALLVEGAARGHLVIEDLGDQTLELALRAPGADQAAIYGAAIDALAGLRARAEQAPDAGCLAFGRAFDFELYQWEFEHFLEYGLLGRGARPSEAELLALRAAFTRVSQELAAAPRGFTHRDYQSRNIMVLPSGDQVVIDFQDALQGPRQYDLVALLRDSYVELPRALVEQMLRRYLRAFAEAGGPRLPEEAFIGFFDLLTVQRKLKDAGRFVFIDQVKKNPSFLPHIPSSLKYVKDALARRPELAEAAEILARHVPELRT